MNYLSHDLIEVTATKRLVLSKVVRFYKYVKDEVRIQKLNANDKTV